MPEKYLLRPRAWFMKRIAICTFSKALNYGAVLQAYALKRTIQSMGKQAFCIDYHAGFYPDTRFRRKLRFLWKSWKKTFSGYPFAPLYFYGFIKQYLQDTPKLLKKDLPRLNGHFDLFITGSDQVWNAAITKGDTAFLLDFVTDSQQKASYSASFGFSYIEEEFKPICARLLQQIPHISVREQTGADIVRELTGKEVPVVLDPTLLLTKSQWLSFAKPTTRSRYILMYLMDANDKIISFAKNLARLKSLPLLAISATPLKDIPYLMCTPQEFIGYFQKAAYVVTNSFHGLSFSINLNKTFFVDRLPPSWPANSRLEQLLATVQLEDRWIDNLTELDAAIDWPAVNKRLEDSRKKSFDFLRMILNQPTPNSH